MSKFIKDFHTQFIVDIYFSAPGRRKTFKKGEVLLRQEQFNDRLYLVLSGAFRGYAANPDGTEIQIFTATPQMFIGVNSFFSTSRTMTNVVALEESVVAYISYKEAVELAGGAASLAEQFLPIIINELIYRQQQTHEIAGEKEKTLKKLIQSEKMASLGQMAAGIAHELNNAIVVLEKNTSWLAERIRGFIASNNASMLPFFVAGYQSGRSISNNEMREKFNRLRESLGLSEDAADLLSQTSIPESELKKLGKKLEPEARMIGEYWEAGATIKDMLIAAHHATHVVKTVKTLGAGRREQRERVSIDESIRETITLMQSNLRRISVELNLNNVPPVIANMGELIQVWSNLMRNACESMLAGDTADPKLTIDCSVKNGEVVVAVTDNGPGIPEEIRESIFQPNVTTKKEGLSFGLGLGLTIVQRIVDSWGGKINVDSSPGRTTFTVILPIGESHEQA